MSIFHPFEQQASASPGRTALVDAQREISYDALHDAAAHIACALTADGIAAGDLVAIYGGRTAGLPAAMLGVWKAGAAFLILDPAYPVSRLTDYIRRSRPKAIIAVGDNAPAVLATASEAVRITLEIDETSLCVRLRAVARNEATQTCAGSLPETAAYVSFTSGTTGMPSGVVGTHKPVVHFLDWYIQKFQFDQNDRFSMLSGLSHDPLLRDICTPLWCGATLCVPDETTRTNATALVAWLRASRVTVLHLTPSLARLIFTAARPGSLPELRYALFGGEPLTWSVWSAFREIAPNVKGVNLYGATETPQAMSFYEIPGNCSTVEGTVPVGRGIDDVILRILDESGNEVETGVEGEVYIQTAYLSDGYLNDDASTAARFLSADRFHASSAERLYRTGDVGRTGADGQLSIAGRKDRELKIRGTRVNPAEIECLLNAMPDIQQAMVVPRTSQSGALMLVAYILQLSPGLPAPDAVRRRLQEQLPVASVPSHVIAIHDIPVTQNGKLDVGRLPDPFAAPTDARGATESGNACVDALRQIFAKVLGTDPARIGSDDNFFALGGDSLSGAILATEIQIRFDISLSLNELAPEASPAGLARYLSSPDVDRVGSLLLPLRSEGRGVPLFVVHPISGVLMSLLPLVRHLAVDRPIYGIQARGLDCPELVLFSIEEMAAEYIRQIKTVQPAGPYAVCGFSAGASVAFEIAQQLQRANDCVESLILYDGSARSDGLTALSTRVRTRWDEWISSPWRDMMMDVVNSLRFRAKMAFFALAKSTKDQPSTGFLNAHQAFVVARQKYRPTRYPGPALLILSTRDEAAQQEPRLGWTDLVTELEVCEIDCIHDHVDKEPHVRIAAAGMSAYLNSSHGGSVVEAQSPAVGLMS